MHWNHPTQGTSFPNLCTAPSFFPCATWGRQNLSHSHLLWKLFSQQWVSAWGGLCPFSW